MAFEPQRVLFELLRDNCRSNGAFNVRLFQFALAHERGATELTPVDHSSAELDLGSVQIGSHSGAGERVLVFPLDDIATKQPLRLIRIDVRGAEVPVLRGAARRLMADRPLLLLSIDDHAARRFQYTRDGICELIFGLGYSVFMLDQAPGTEHFCVPNEQLGDLRSTLARFVRPDAPARRANTVAFT
jgi:FkbM family methyltransferase